MNLEQKQIPMKNMKKTEYLTKVEQTNKNHALPLLQDTKKYGCQNKAIIS